MGSNSLIYHALKNKSHRIELLMAAKIVMLPSGTTASVENETVAIMSDARTMMRSGEV